eukprot:150030-Hanusia_phi.AAC.1
MGELKHGRVGMGELKHGRVGLEHGRVGKEFGPRMGIAQQTVMNQSAAIDINMPVLLINI